MNENVFPVLLKHWRNSRGLSQLDLSLVSEVSSRHISFLETGRSRPSEEMILRLGASLDIPLRDRNTLLTAAGYAPRYRDDDHTTLLDGVIGQAIQAMKASHEPYPLIVHDHLYNVLDMTNGAMKIFDMLGAYDRNVLRATFNPSIRDHIENWEEVARGALERLHGQVLSRPYDEELRALFDELKELAGFETTLLAMGQDLPAISVRLLAGGARLSFLTTMTVFNAPQNVALEELVIEGYYPTDDETRAFFDA